MTDFRMAQPMYDPTAVEPMREELRRVGVKELRTPEDVDAALKESGTTLVVVNSVCGCAAGNARPGVMIALQHGVIPDRITTVFAGQDRPATERARAYMKEIPPSSPCIALFKDGEAVHCLQRMHIENQTAQQVAASLIGAFEEHCKAQGPSIPAEEFARIVPYMACGSTIPLARPGA
jgi:putative YphP/YqiW family bacilliredoxin